VAGRLPLAGGTALTRDAEFAGEDPLSHNDWIYACDAGHAAAAATPAG
jgi:hypothetical protein